jgi:hypothetical protein
VIQTGGEVKMLSTAWTLLRNSGRRTVSETPSGNLEEAHMTLTPNQEVLHHRENVLVRRQRLAVPQPEEDQGTVPTQASEGLLTTAQANTGRLNGAPPIKQGKKQVLRLRSE